MKKIKIPPKKHFSMMKKIFFKKKSRNIFENFEILKNDDFSKNFKIFEILRKFSQIFFFVRRIFFFGRKFQFLSEFLSRPPRLDANNGISALKPVPAPPEPSALN